MPPSISVQVWASIAQWLVYGAGVAGAIMSLSKFINWCRSKTTVAKLSEEIDGLRGELVSVNEKLKKDNIRLSNLEVENDSIYEDLKDIHKLLQLSIKSSQALLRGTLDGNNKDNIRMVSAEIDEYLNNQI